MSFGSRAIVSNSSAAASAKRARHSACKSGIGSASGNWRRERLQRRRRLVFKNRRALLEITQAIALQQSRIVVHWTCNQSLAIAALIFGGVERVAQMRNLIGIGLRRCEIALQFVNTRVSGIGASAQLAMVCSNSRVRDCETSVRWRISSI